MQELVKSSIRGKKVMIAGFGREGRSTYRYLRDLLPQYPLTIADLSDNIRSDKLLQQDPNLEIVTGEGYLCNLESFDQVYKTPGIPTAALPPGFDRKKITSQTDLFLRLFSRQAIGVTGTKGKSTTASLMHCILNTAGCKTLFAGNIGIPLLDIAPQVTDDTTIIMELSSHQLEYISVSPHISVLLNIFQEHLDHYNNYEEYQEAKFNIGRYQTGNDYFIYNHDNNLITKKLSECNNCSQNTIPYSLRRFSGNGAFYHDKKVWLHYHGKETVIFDDTQGHKLRGDHNLLNIMAAASACYLSGIGEPAITSAVRVFDGLEHRIEFIGRYREIEFYNDSIATIPEACIEAVKTLQRVETLILGGFDRGIDYGILYPFLKSSTVKNLIFTGEAGRRMKSEFEKSGIHGKSLFDCGDYAQIVDIAFNVTSPGSICLLSPAAASYDMFRNFEERGKVFKKLVREHQ